MFPSLSGRPIPLQNFFAQHLANRTWPRIRGPTFTFQASKALDTSVRKLSCIYLCEDVRMTSTGNDDRLDAQDPTRRRLLPLWPDLVVSRSRNVHVVDLRQRFQRTDFVKADHGMSGWQGVDAFLHCFELRLRRIGIVHEL